MITQRYDYTKLSKKEDDTGKRKYLTPDGRKVASVTTILEITKPEEDKQALQNWRNAVGHKKAKEITTEAANRGTRMHTYLEGFVLNDQLKDAGSNPYAKISHLMAQTVIKEGLHKADEFWGSEVSLYFPEIYAGTTDLVGVHGGAEAIMDFKQSNKPKQRAWIEGYFLQCAAYGAAHDALYGTKIRKGVIMMCVKPKVDAQFNIIEPPQYQEFIIEGEEFDHYAREWWKRVEQHFLLNM